MLVWIFVCNIKHFESLYKSLLRTYKRGHRVYNKKDVVFFLKAAFKKKNQVPGFMQKKKKDT